MKINSIINHLQYFRRDGPSASQIITAHWQYPNTRCCGKESCNSLSLAGFLTAAVKAMQQSASPVNDDQHHSTSNISATASKTQKTARARPMTWRFDFQLQMPKLSDREEVRVASCQVLDDANKKSAMYGLMQSSFSYDVPDEGGLVNISG